MYPFNCTGLRRKKRPFWSSSKASYAETRRGVCDLAACARDRDREGAPSHIIQQSRNRHLLSPPTSLDCNNAARPDLSDCIEPACHHPVEKRRAATVCGTAYDDAALDRLRCVEQIKS